MAFEFDERTRRMLGDEAVEFLAGRHLIVLGVGGVGGYAAEALCRAGVGHLTLIDGDRVTVSNRNRQLYALKSTESLHKAEVAAARCRDINPDGTFQPVVRFVTPETAAGIFDEFPADGIVDAIDDVPAKTALILAALARRIPLVSSMGAGGKSDPAQVRVADMAKSCGCPLARVIRSELRKAGVKGGFPAVFSPETPVKRPGNTGFGTLSYMPGIFGFHCAAAMLDVLLARRLLQQ